MSLSELMSSMNLAIWPTIALVIFLAVFAAVIWRVLSPLHRETHQRLGSLPLEEGQCLVDSTLPAVATTRSNWSTP
jgi:hypothetical protein